MHQIHRTPLRIPLADVDHAGLVYFAQAFHYFHLAYEDFLAQVVGVPLENWLERGLGAPIVRSSADFRGPLRHGMGVEARAWLTALGTSSWTWAFELAAKETEPSPQVVGEVVMAFVELATMRPRPLDPTLRDAAEPYLAKT